MKQYVVAYLTLHSLYLSACDSGQLPVGTNVTLSPSKQSVALVDVNPNQTPVCITGDDGIYQDIPILISVATGGGVPVGGAEVILYSDYSANTFSGPNLIQIYADKNGNGVIDADTELVSSSDSDAYKTKTDQYNGTAMVFVRMNITCPYVGNLMAFVGSSVAQTQFDVFLSDKFDIVNPASSMQ